MDLFGKKFQKFEIKNRNSNNFNISPNACKQCKQLSCRNLFMRKVANLKTTTI